MIFNNLKIFRSIKIGINSLCDRIKDQGYVPCDVMLIIKKHTQHFCSLGNRQNAFQLIYTAEYTKNGLFCVRLKFTWYFC